MPQTTNKKYTQDCKFFKGSSTTVVAAGKMPGVESVTTFPRDPLLGLNENGAPEFLQT